MRYKLIDSKKFKLGIGAHPAYVFQTTPIVTNGIVNDVIITKRFFGGELVPTFVVNKKNKFRVLLPLFSWTCRRNKEYKFC
jgi:hypothetical protein